MSWLDLHIHSAMSCDGEFSPRELMKLCKKAGLKVAAIADHNTTKAVKEAGKYAIEYGITLIPAIELDCMAEGVLLHVLGYGICPDASDFERIQNDVEEQEQEASQKRLQLVKDMGIKVDEDAAYALASNGYITGEIIAEVALENPENHKILSEYLQGGTREDNPYVNFYWDICSQGKPAYVPISFISLEEAVRVISSAGGVAVLAHPGNNVKEQECLLKKIYSYDIKGIEAFSSYHTKEQTKYYLEWAQAHNIFPTVGSDFHGKTKPSIQLGSVDCFGKEDEIYHALLK